MKSKEVIEEELEFLHQHKRHLEKELEVNFVKITLLDMRIESLEWVLKNDE